MRAWIRSIGRWLVLAGAVTALSISATSYSLWINGRTGGGQIGNYATSPTGDRAASLPASTRSR